MIISGRFTVARPPQGVHSIAFGIRGEIACRRIDAVVVSRPTYVASNAAVGSASGTHRIVR